MNRHFQASQASQPMGHLFKNNRRDSAAVPNNPFGFGFRSVSFVCAESCGVCIELTALLKWMLALDLHRRATIRDVERHRWTRQPVTITDYDWNTLMQRSR